ncbi:MAG: hypothetical protein AAF892_15170 [Cyanobacteria bacterium P01_D01_bin.71]
MVYRTLTIWKSAAAATLWMVTDMSTSKHNLAVPDRADEAGNPVSQSNLRGLFGNNSV